MNSSLLCFGLGYSARVLARRLVAEGWAVAGTSRSGEPGTMIFDRTRPLAAEAFAGTTHLLVSVPPDGEGDPVLDCHASDIATLPGLVWLGYLSTTGVYGDRGGGWVDEASTPAPTGERGSDYPGCRTGATEGSASSVSAMRLCLSRVHAQKPQDRSAPTASGRRSPKRSLNEPISTAPTAGPARKIMP